MARKPRIHRIGAFYHIMLRGNNGQPIFFSNVDRIKLCLLIQEGIERFGYRIYGFCLMNNHIHLVFQSGTQHISVAMQNLAFRYTRYINRNEKRIGHLFQGRFKAILVDDREYLLELIRYIHLNPVRAGIVSRPEDYLWSSHRAYLGIGTVLWLSKDWVLSKFSSHESTARTHYEAYIKRGMGEQTSMTDFKTGSHEGRFLGTDEFVKQVLKENHQIKNMSTSFTLEELINIVCKIIEVPESILHSPGKNQSVIQLRAMIAYFVKRSPHLTLKEFADFAGKDLSSVSRLAYKLELNSQSDNSLSNSIDRIKRELEALRIARLQA